MDYKIIDSGNRKKLEQWGKIRLIRPEPKAMWKPILGPNEWKLADAEYFRGSHGGGEWKYHNNLPESWILEWEQLRFKIKPTGFKHMGLFPEHEHIWKYVQNSVSKGIQNGIQQPRILNLFGYTGAATLAASAAGAHVTHVDGSKGTINWARENAELSGLGQKPIRWLNEDVITYARREQKRGSQYEGIIMDAPAFGRGAKGEIWKFEDNVNQLLELSKQLLSNTPLFVILISYATDCSPTILKQLMQQYISGEFETGELQLHQESNEFVIPLANFAICTCS